MRGGHVGIATYGTVDNAIALVQSNATNFSAVVNVVAAGRLAQLAPMRPATAAEKWPGKGEWRHRPQLASRGHSHHHGCRQIAVSPYTSVLMLWTMEILADETGHAASALAWLLLYLAYCPKENGGYRHAHGVSRRRCSYSISSTARDRRNRWKGRRKAKSV